MKSNNSSSRVYWERVEEEFEETVSEEVIENHYDEDKLPDLEELALSCPYDDLSERLLIYARVIECHLIEEEDEKEIEEGIDSYLELCFDIDK